MNKVDVPKQVSTPSQDLPVCVPYFSGNAPQMDTTEWFPFHNRSYERLYAYVSTRNKSMIHFLTLRPSTSYICSRYFNNVVPSKEGYKIWFTNKLNKLLNKYNVKYCYSMEDNVNHNIGVHAHIILCNITKRKSRKIMKDLRHYYTIQHLIENTQYALIFSDKDYEKLDKGIKYFLGKKKMVTDFHFKPSFIQHQSNFTFRDVNRSIKIINKKHLEKINYIKKIII